MPFTVIYSLPPAAFTASALSWPGPASSGIPICAIWSSETFVMDPSGCTLYTDHPVNAREGSDGVSYVRYTDVPFG